MAFHGTSRRRLAPGSVSSSDSAEGGIVDSGVVPEDLASRSPPDGYCSARTTGGIRAGERLVAQTALTVAPTGHQGIGTPFSPAHFSSALGQPPRSSPRPR